MNDFMPDDYEQPKSKARYVKFEQGDTRIRILTKPITGTIAWTKEDAEGKKKPIRYVLPKQTIDESATDGEKQKHFWAMFVWNYKEEVIQVWEVTQATIQGALLEMARNAKWGSPLAYDIVVTKKGEKMDTEYTVLPEPKAEITDAIKDEWLKVQGKANLEALFTNGDPFGEEKK